MIILRLFLYFLKVAFTTSMNSFSNQRFLSASRIESLVFLINEISSISVFSVNKIMKIRTEKSVTMYNAHNKKGYTFPIL